MKRRQFIQWTGASLLATAGLGVAKSAFAQTGSVTIQSLGHMCFLFSGDGRRILVNPFRPLGCTAGYRAPQVNADLVMISSRLLDEGATEGLPGSPRILSEPGIFEFTGMQVQGISTDHDLLGGRRFGRNVVWRWNQGGIGNILHMGGAAAPVTVEQQILMGRPDVALIPVGGGPKAYTPEAARAAIQTLNPRIIIPTQYLTQAADTAACEIQPLENFLALMDGTPIDRRTDSISLSTADLPDTGSRIIVLDYAF
jgi:L-ascorbate metabolism protein UlaG (beta-lactamase superfamily)